MYLEVGVLSVCFMLLVVKLPLIGVFVLEDTYSHGWGAAPVLVQVDFWSVCFRS